MTIRDTVLEKVNTYPVNEDAPSLSQIAKELYPRAVTNAHIESNPVKREDLIDKVYEIMTLGSLCAETPTQDVRNQIKNKIRGSIENHEPIRIAMMALPFRCRCIYETAGENAGLSELLELNRLLNYDATIRKVYPHGTEMIMLLDGHYYRELGGHWDAPLESINIYEKGIRSLANIIDPGSRVIKVLDLQKDILDKTDYRTIYPAKYEHISEGNLKSEHGELLEPMCRAVDLDRLDCSKELLARPELTGATRKWYTGLIPTIIRVYSILKDHKNELIKLANGELPIERWNIYRDLELDEGEINAVTQILNAAKDMVTRYVAAADARYQVMNSIMNLLPQNTIYAGITAGSKRLSIQWLPAHRGIVDLAPNQQITKIGNYPPLLTLLGYNDPDDAERVDVDSKGVPSYWKYKVR